MSAGTFPYRHQPYRHQVEALRRSARRENFGLFLEQGLGKTKVVIDNVAFLYMYQRDIDALLVIAPNGVHTNWNTDEIPEHMPEPVEWLAMEWIASKAGNKSFLEEYNRLVAFPGLAIFTMNIEAVSTAKGKKALKHFLTKRKVFWAVDESTDIKNPTNKRSRYIYSLRHLAKYRRILSGTPAGDGTPFDYFGQFKFLDPAILGNSLTSFKGEYAEMMPAPWDGAPKFLQVVKRYRNLDRLHEIIGQHSFRLTKDELIASGDIDLVPKAYTKQYIQLSPQQAKAYREMKEDYITEVGEGQIATALLTITRYLRLQQIVQGYVPVEADENGDAQPVALIPGPLPRMDDLGEWLERLGGRKFIIWSRFHLDHDMIMERYGKRYGMVRYDGTVPKGQRDENKHRFLNDPKCLGFLGNQKAGGRGLTLNIARNTLYYSNYFDLEWRLQSEDRNHRIGNPTLALYTDFIAKGTIDVKIVGSLRNKKSVADTLTGDPQKDWL